MASPVIKIKRSSVQNNAPTAAQLELGELALNTYDGKLFTEINDGTVSIVEIGGHLQHLAVSGISTFTGAIDANGDLDVDGHTNLDNVIVAGIVTASEGIKIPFDDKFLLLGASNDLSLAHTAGHSYIADTGTGDLRITGSAIRIQNAVQNEDMAVFIQNGAAELYHDNSKKLETLSTGINVTGNVVSDGADIDGDLDVDGTANLDAVDIDGAVDMASSLTIAGNIDANGDIDVDGHTELDHVNIAGVATINQLKMGDNKYLQLGNGPDLQLYHDGSNSYVNEISSTARISTCYR